MLQLLYSNRYETLVDALSEDLSAMPADPWSSEELVVPSAAVRRHLELELARRRGICANVNFSYLAQWLWMQIGRAMDVPVHSPLAVERLQWRCYRLFGAREGELGQAWRASPRLAAYLAGADEAMRYELARRVATLFDHYLTYRPEWLARWQRGQSIFDADAPASAGGLAGSLREDEGWQAALWRAVLAELAGTDDPRALEQASPPAHRFLEVARKLDLDAVMRARWPASVSVVALPTIAPLHIALLRELSHWIDVRLYVANPCRQFWFDIVSEGRAFALEAAGTLDFHEVGHPLLAEWGRQTQAQLHLLHELTEGAASAEATRFVPNPQASWLAKLQNAMLDLVPETAEPPPERGIEVHVCHSLSRQLEVLHDRLLDWFNADRDTSGGNGASARLEPADVLVACPDLVAAAPLIDAVFGTAPADERRRIPYRITGLPASQANPVARVLLDWLARADRNVAAPELVEWLRVDALAARYRIDAGALDTAQAWLAAAGARRGLAPAMPMDPDVPPERHTFADALMRLFLGYAMPDGGEPVDAWLPVPGAAGAEAELLGRLARFVDDIEQFIARASEAGSCEAWTALLEQALQRFFDAGPAFSDSIAAVRDAVDATLDAMRESAGDACIPADVVRAALGAALDDGAYGGVPGGGVTFSSLTSLRGLPYRVICLIGMDDGVLPSHSRADEFDLMAARPALGDRQRRADERNLFLDLLLAARERFVITYTGRSIRDNAPLPPAALVDELLDHLARAQAGADATPAQTQAARDTFIVEHPLQPFSRVYFEPATGLFTYDRERAQLAERLAAGDAAPVRPFFYTPLAPEPAGPIAFTDFARFWRHPARELLRERLGIALEAADGELDDTEPFELDYAARDALAERLLPRLITHGDDAMLARAARIAEASPELPVGATGDVMKHRELAALTRLAGDVRAQLAVGAARLSFVVHVTPCWPDVHGVALFGEHDAAIAQGLGDAGPVELHGVLENVTSNGLVLYRYARPGARDYLGAWLAHLVYCAAQPDGPRRTTWQGLGERFSFAPVAAPNEMLAPLVALFFAGRRAPLRFFPKSAWARVTGSEAQALGVWISDRVRGESDDPALEIAWRGAALTLDEPFAVLARLVFEPLLKHLEGAAA
ncbi:exodeoxyribonuclease V subunit gamma [Paraburkholderia sp. NMBU_R16]|uniref:exodeoxyribonuclease V subunit gamma n=1 Tax=Paraburkholderia sp. NMBU_R16 TaxID=2698676 RepID=UPI0015677126|nr:exodeoxyribonuclease V subunit gamma [Paraburkholderia sp. NMBU_R16]NRO94486.1 exodeoxyribonuclease V subunit gamma [Paraburkholderia sp. NMBU_R16]